MNENLEEMMDERGEKQQKNAISFNSTSRRETPKNTNKEDGETNASDTENQEKKQDNLFRPSESKELRTPVQPIFIQNFDLDDTVIKNEDPIGEDYHRQEV